MEKVFFTLVRAVLRDETPESLPEVSPELLQKLYKLAEAHDLLPIIGQGLSKLDLLGNDETSEAFKKQMFQAAHRYARQNRALQQICRTLEENEIPFIPLKGSVIRDLYPQSWLRTSGDIDVLVKPEDLDRAVELLQAVLSYTFKYRLSHDVTMHTPDGVCIELHFDTIEEDRTGATVLQTLWDTVTPVPGHQYYCRMTPEMFYYYHIAHMAKHFQNGGCGIRPFLDLWILREKMPVPWEKLQALLRQGGLWKFSDYAWRLSEYWMADGPSEPVTENMRAFLLGGGVYGSMENKATVYRSKKGSTGKYALQRIFMPYGRMRRYYPVLDKVPVLLPVYWGVHAVQAIGRGRLKAVARELRVNKNLDQEKVKTTRSLLDDLGLLPENTDA